MYKRLLMSFACCLCLGQILSSTAMADITSKQEKAIADSLYKGYQKTSEGKRARETPDIADRSFYFSATQGILTKIQDTLHISPQKSGWFRKGVSEGEIKEQALNLIYNQLEALTVVAQHADPEYQKNLRITLTGLKFLADCAREYPEGLKRIRSLMGDYYYMKQETFWPDLVSMVYPDGSLLKGASADQEFLDYVQENVTSNSVEDTQALAVIKELFQKMRNPQKKQKRKDFDEALRDAQQKAPTVENAMADLSKEKDAEDTVNKMRLNQGLDTQEEQILERMKKRMEKRSQKKHPEEKLSSTSGWAEITLGKHRKGKEDPQFIKDEDYGETPKTESQRQDYQDKTIRKIMNRERAHNPKADEIHNEISRTPSDEEIQGFMGGLDEQSSVWAEELKNQQSTVKKRIQKRKLKKATLKEDNYEQDYTNTQRLHEELGF